VESQRVRRRERLSQKAGRNAQSERNEKFQDIGRKWGTNMLAHPEEEKEPISIDKGGSKIWGGDEQ